jgi:hypothetical protein
MGVGRPTKYKIEYAEQAVKLSEMGATDAQLADFFEVDVSSISLWKVKHPEFKMALTLGKDVADEGVERSLYQRAMGYEYDDVDIRVIEGKIVQTPIRRRVPPDTSAMIFWLKNRKKSEWRDKVEQAVTHTFEELSDEEIKRKIAELTNGQANKP